MTISCSYLSSNDKEKVINELNKTNVDYIHLDIMDGKFDWVNSYKDFKEKVSIISGI